VISKTREAIRSLSLFTILAGVGVAGALMIWLSHSLPWQLAQEITKELGAAVLIAAILGITVDRGLKTELAKDVFFAAFRYVLPDELKSEVLRIINYRLMSHDHLVIVEIVPINNDLVRVNISVERTVKNIGRGPEDVYNMLAVDEWGFPDHKSSIDVCFMEIGNKRIEAAPSEEHRQGAAIARYTEKKPLQSNETARLVSKGSEVHRMNSNLALYFITATDHPVLEVRLPSDICHTAGFGVPGAKVQRSELWHRYSLEGTQFPGQAMQVRWWRDASVSAQVAPSSELRPS